MAKSKIVKDIANGNVSLDISLKRALIIAHDLKNKKMEKWINNELYGYQDPKEIPEYRKLLGTPKMSYVTGYTQVTNQSVTSGVFPNELKDAIFYKCCDSIKTIEELLNSGNSATVSLTEYIPYLKIQSHVSVMSFFLEISLGAFRRIIDNVAREIMEILLKIDDEIGCIDELDISVSDEQNQKINQIINVQIDSFINIGNDNDLSNINFAGENIINHGKK